MGAKICPNMRLILYSVPYLNRQSVLSSSVYSVEGKSHTWVQEVWSHVNVCKEGDKGPWENHGNRCDVMTS